MRLLSLLFVLIGFVASPVARAVEAADQPLLASLQMCMTHGLEPALRALYAERPELGAEMTAKVVGASGRLGSLIDTEVVAVQSVSKRVTRYYVALYFTRSPLWLRIDRYQSRDKGFFLPLTCSTNPDEILPGYVTEFMASRNG